jgi:hypothetical protein
MIHFAILDSPHLPLSRLSTLGAQSLARGLFQLGQRPLLEKLFIGNTLNPGVVGIEDVGTLGWVMRALIRGRKDGPGLQLSLRRVRQLMDSHRGILDVPGAEEKVYKVILEEYATREASEEFERIWQDVREKGLKVDEAMEVKGLRMSSRGKRTYEVLYEELRTRQKEARLGVQGWNWMLQARLDDVGNPSSEAPSSSSAITDLAEQTVNEMRSANVEPDQGTFVVIVSAQILRIPVGTLVEEYVDRVWEASSILGLDPEDKVWEACVEQVIGSIKNSGMEEADKRESIYSAYERAVRAGSKVTIRLARLVVDQMAMDSAGLEPDYARANNIKADLAAAMDESKEIMLDSERTLKERDDDLRAIHLVCLQGAMRRGSEDATVKDIIPDTIAVLDEMRKRSVALPHQMTLDTILDLMSRAQHHHDAFRAYSYVRALAPGRLSEEDHLEILQHFIRLSLPKSPWPLPKLTFEFLRDMRDSGLPVRAKVYTMMVNEYTRYLRRRRKGRGGSPGSSATTSATPNGTELGGPDQRILSNTLQTIQKIHSIVKLDSFLDVDLPLLTSLMDAYNQLQLWPETFELWNEIVARHRMERGVDPDVESTQTALQRMAYRPGLSVILDACGYSGHLSRARRIWEWAHERDMIRCSYGNWKSWIECLCRCGKTMEACDVVRGPFKKQWLAAKSAQGSTARLARIDAIDKGDDDVNTGEPDLLIAQSSKDDNELPVLEMLVRFSWRDKSDWLEVRAMIETEFPEQWEVLRARKMVKGRESAAQQYGE